ncbi:MAG: proton-conducting transporter membrane subunit [Candidatus Auribacterota bacterium]|jgi:formate hydrogenlyase subunit 3/multisubunit Na+/H+ antiporter MnhD subunit|nr:proton-conducting transporter membrane subunit [Candidatus Auribacterota bacterium]
MNFMLFSPALFILSGLCALLLHKYNKVSNCIGAFGVVTGCIAGLVSLFNAYTNPESVALSVPWSIPYGSFSIAIDAIGAIFLFPIFILSAVCAVYGLEYLRHYYGKKNTASAWFFFNLLIASMILVVISRNAVLFLIAWEMMSISSFFLVLFEGEKKEVAKAGLIYLIATHIGTLFLLVMFVLLGNEAGSFDFNRFQITAGGLLPSIMFISAVIGFGTKAGFMPMHVWLPEAHPAAPSHVSAVMSGVMIKTGIYGLLRVITFIEAPCAWWGYLLIGIGMISGILGVLFALAQHDLKRLMAYSSIENIGIISMGIGLGILGISTQNPVLAILGFAGGLLHIVNHAFFKGLLFLGAGVVLHQTGTKEIDVLGGLLKKMPVTGFCFLIGVAAICGLPPLNGFISEFLIYLASFKNILAEPSIAIVSLGCIASLALIGGLAVTCFTKVFGIIFSGEPRSSSCQNAHEPGMLMIVPLIILAFACVAIGISFPFILPKADRLLADITGISPDLIRTLLSGTMNPLIYITTAGLLLYSGLFLFAVLRRMLLKGRTIDSVPTWDCGYAKPDPRMQYTASSYVQPIVDFFKGILRTQKHGCELIEYFPDSSSFKTKTSDIFQENLFAPLLAFIHRCAESLKWFQHGKLQVYILYILFTLVALFIWKL